LFNEEEEGERLGLRLSYPIVRKGLDTSASSTVKEAKYEIVNSVVPPRKRGWDGRGVSAKTSPVLWAG